MFNDKKTLDLGEMHAPCGISLKFESTKLATKTALRIAERIKSEESYKLLESVLPPDKVALFFETRIVEKICSPIKNYCVSQWVLQNSDQEKKPEVFWSNHHGLGLWLKDVWPSQEIPLHLGRSHKISHTLKTGFRSFVGALENRIGLLKLKYVRQTLPLSSKPTIAIHYREGIDFSRRSDLYWYSDSLIGPKRVIVFFDGRYPKSFSPIPERVLQEIENKGMLWCTMEKGLVERSKPFSWYIDEKKHWEKELVVLKESLLKLRQHDPWVFEMAHSLLREVNYWVSFYKTFNIKIHFEMEEANPRNPSQFIALDLLGGVFVGKQRSEFLAPPETRHGYYPRHVYFSWGFLSRTHLDEGKNRIESLVVSGFPYSGSFGTNLERNVPLKMAFNEKKVQFVVALFDNVFGPEIQFSKKMMLDFYRIFLNWLMEDPELGLVIKSKKPFVLENLPGIHPLLEEAQRTGRCMRLGNIEGRLPSDASQVADMSVGVGISSAVMEAAIAGKRGIHWDPTGVLPPVFYPWGRERIIFEDINRLVTTLRCYKGDPASDPFLGDFSPILNQMDPFLDGHSGNRVGCYIRWLLEGFDAGCSKDEAIQQANSKYANDFGQDKIIQLTRVAQKVCEFPLERTMQL